MGSNSFPKLPVLDFSRQDLKPGTAYWVKTCSEVRQALEEFGCFIIESNQTLQPQFQTQVFGALKDLFDLPTQTKMKNKYEHKPLTGYVGQIPQLPLHESLGIENSTSLQSTKSFTDLMWPDGNHSSFW